MTVILLDGLHESLIFTRSASLENTEGLLWNVVLISPAVHVAVSL